MRIKLLTSMLAPIVLITILATTIRLYSLGHLMPFIGDQAWFFLSARDSLADGTIPLIGIPASRVWLHQGPFWTYILMGIFSLFGYEPVIAGYMTAFIGVLAVVAIYYILLSSDNKKTAVIGAFLYATSPLVIVSDRMPYHTTLTPLIMIGVYWTLWKIMQGRSRLLPLLVGFVATMQNINLAAFPLIYILAGFVGYGALMKKSWITKISAKTYLYSCLIWLLCMMPSIIYDISHGFPQTVKFYAWLLVQPVYSLVHQTESSFIPIIKFSILTIQRLLFLPSTSVSMFLFAGALLYSFRHITHDKKHTLTPLMYSFIWTIGMLLIVLLGKTPSQAYVYALYPLIILLSAQVVGLILSQDTQRAWLLYVLIAVIGAVNCFSLVDSKYLMGSAGGYGAPLVERKELARTIVSQADGKPFRLKVEGPGAQFRSTGMYMEYLTWLMGHPPTPDAERVFEIYEKDGKLKMHSPVAK